VESPLCRPDTRLIETFRWEAGRFHRLQAHLSRAQASANALGFAWNRRAIDAALASVGGASPLRVRLTLGRAGDAEVTMGPLAPNLPEWRVGLAPARLSSADPLLRHKTTERALYDRARAELAPWIDEMLFFNERDEACEGTITNLFVDFDGHLLTPPLAAGCLPGILRAELLAKGRAREATLTLADLAAKPVFMGNALRGLIPARLMF